MGRLVFCINEWASGEIRGMQMAHAVGGVVEPPKFYSDDVLVCIKRLPPPDLVSYVKCVYVDVNDCYGLIPYLKGRLDVTPVAASRVGHKYLQEQLGRNNVLMIPGHHCNFERDVRVTGKVKTAGFIGYPENLQLGIDELHKALDEIGIAFVAKVDAKSREDVCNFYKSIDIQICFRKKSETNPAPELRDPLKLINAGSFGIPTVAYPEPSYADEFNGCFVPVRSLSEVIEVCKWLSTVGAIPDYNDISMRARCRAEHYHIEHISPMFRRLLDD